MLVGEVSIKQLELQRDGVSQTMDLGKKVEEDWHLWRLWRALYRAIFVHLRIGSRESRVLKRFFV